MKISQNCDLSPWSSLDEILSLSQTKLSVSPASALKTELDIYLSEGLTSGQENPIHWWGSNNHRFPRLSKIARTYLVSPPTSVPSERVFKIAGKTLDY